ncbi:MAG TPA: hypothetical protein DCR20_04020 [Planctomycetaceae bacterium]|nr:hypothetical protein [Planctomycetaceae bacterium]
MLSKPFPIPKVSEFWVLETYGFSELGTGSVLISRFLWDLQMLKARYLLLTLTLVFSFGTPSIAQAQSDEPASPLQLIQEGKRPLLTITFSGADRFMSKAKYIFEASEHTEVFGMIETFMKESMNDLEGFNRGKPFGIMGYLPVAFPPLPEFVAFVPVDSVEAATKLVEKAPVVISKGSEEGRYEVIGPNRTFPVLMRDGYAFIPLGNTPDAKILEREFPDPADLLAGQAQEFDAAVRLDVESIPAATRTLLYGLINSGISTQLQQRDGEAEGAYRIRRTEGERGLAALKMLFMDCQKITFGVNISEDEQAVNLDMVIDAIKGSQMLKEMFSSTERPSYFIPLLDENAAVSVSISSLMADREKEAYGEMMEGFRMEVARLIEENKLGPVPDENSPIGQAMTAIQKTLQEGHMDIFAQFYRDSAGKLAIVWAGRVQDGEAINSGAMDVLTRLKDIEEVQSMGELQINAGEHHGVMLHRLTFAAQPPEAVAVFGDNVGMTMGMGSTAIWGVIGGEESLATLKSVMDKLEEAQATAADQRTPPNFRVIINVNQLVEMAEIAREVSMTRRSEREAEAGAEAAIAQTAKDAPVAGAGAGASAAPAPPAPGTSGAGAAPGGPGAGRGFGRGGAGRGRGGFQPSPAQAAAMQRRAEQGRQIALETLKEGDDRIEIDSRLTETGARLRVRLEQGFVKLFGRLVANGISGGEAEEAPQATPAPVQ